MPWKLIASAGIFVGGILASFVLGISGIVTEGDTYVQNSGSGSVIVQSPADGVTCPTGWANTSAFDEHTVQLSCSRGDWIYFLNPDGSEAYAWDGESPEFVYEPSLVPGWE
jgi:hypothetical protein